MLKTITRLTISRGIPRLPVLQSRMTLRISMAFLVLLNVFTAGSAQPDTLWNQTDETGMKQGWWRKYYPNGELMYRGFFVDNRPEGQMTRYYNDGNVKAVLRHIDGGKITYADLYFRNGQKGAHGKYVSQARDSIWTYWSYYTGTLSYRESYSMGSKNGISIKYYPGGAEAERMSWKNDMQQGNWEQYYEDGTLRLSSSHEMGEINGPYRIYNRNRILILDGNYIGGKQDGEWKFYDQEGNLERTLGFDMGVLLDKEEYEQWMKQFMDEVESSIGKIPEVDYDNFFER